MGRFLIDGNNLGFAAQSTTKLTAGGIETQAVYGFLRMLRAIRETDLSFKPVVLWDGRSWRYGEFEQYKGNRDANPKMRELRDGYKRQRPYIMRALRHLGVVQMVAANMEADDLAGMLVPKCVDNGTPVLLVTGDKDWLQLVRVGCSNYHPLKKSIVNHRNFAEATGYATPQAFLDGKCLVGDSSDTIPGVGGIGEKGAKELLAKWGSVDALLNASLAPEIVAKMPKKYRDFITNAKGGVDIYRRNLRLMKLDPKALPVKPAEPKLLRGAFNKDAFAELCAEMAFHSMLRDLTNWMKPFQEDK